MSEPIDFKAAKDARQPVCLYCGGKPHATQLACPRIAHISVSEEGYCDGITFRDDFFDEDEDPPPAA